MKTVQEFINEVNAAILERNFPENASRGKGHLEAWHIQRQYFEKFFNETRDQAHELKWSFSVYCSDNNSTIEIKAAPWADNSYPMWIGWQEMDISQAVSFRIKKKRNNSRVLPHHIEVNLADRFKDALPVDFDLEKVGFIDFLAMAADFIRDDGYVMSFAETTRTSLAAYNRLKELGITAKELDQLHRAIFPAHRYNISLCYPDSDGRRCKRYIYEKSVEYAALAASCADLAQLSTRTDNGEQGKLCEAEAKRAKELGAMTMFRYKDETPWAAWSPVSGHWRTQYEERQFTADLEQTIKKLCEPASLWEYFDGCDSLWYAISHEDIDPRRYTGPMTKEETGAWVIPSETEYGPYHGFCVFFDQNANKFSYQPFAGEQELREILGPNCTVFIVLDYVESEF